MLNIHWSWWQRPLQWLWPSDVTLGCIPPFCPLRPGVLLKTCHLMARVCLMNRRIPPYMTWTRALRPLVLWESPLLIAHHNPSPTSIVLGLAGPSVQGLGLWTNLGSSDLSPLLVHLTNIGQDLSKHPWLSRSRVFDSSVQGCSDTVPLHSLFFHQWELITTDA